MKYVPNGHFSLNLAFSRWEKESKNTRDTAPDPSAAFGKSNTRQPIVHYRKNPKENPARGLFGPLLSAHCYCDGVDSCAETGAAGQYQVAVFDVLERLKHFVSPLSFVDSVFERDAGVERSGYVGRCK